MAGPMPGPARRETTGTSVVKKSGKSLNATAKPRATTDQMTAISGTATASTAAPMRPVMSVLLTVRRVVFARRSMAVSGTVFMRRGCAAPSAARSRWRAG